MGRAAELADYHNVVAALDESISHDPRYAAAHALRAIALVDISVYVDDPSYREQVRESARRSAETAVRLAPEFAEAYVARGMARSVGLLNFGAAAGADFDRAMRLAPGSALAQKGFATYSSFVGNFAASVAASSRAIALDPENYAVRHNHVINFFHAHHYTEALNAIEAARKLNSSEDWSVTSGHIYNATAQYASALGACSAPPAPDADYPCLAIAYYAIGEYAQSDEALRKAQLHGGNAGAYDYAEVCAQRHNVAEALKWLRIAEQLRAPDLQNLHVDWTLDPIRNEPEFKALERRLGFPTG